MGYFFLERGFFPKSSLFTRVLLRFFSFFLIYLFVVLFFSCSCGKAAKDPNANNPGSGGGGSVPQPAPGEEHTVGWGQAPDAPWTARSGFEAVIFKDKVWVLGGIGRGAIPTDIIWNTSDGTNWTQVTPVGTVWAPRAFFQAEVFDNKIWVIGGNDDTAGLDYRDIWSSSDGTNWTQITPTGAWPTTGGVEHHQVVVHDSKLWLLGRFFRNDILESSDGIAWTTVNAVAPRWDSRMQHRAEVYNNRMWVVGGDSGRVNFKDVWSSADGINWTEHTVADANWKFRKSFEMVSFNNKLWIFSGMSDKDGDPATPNTVALYKDVWSTTDGADWKESTTTVPWAGRAVFEVVEFKKNLWLIGGQDGGASARYRDVWKFIPEP